MAQKKEKQVDPLDALDVSTGDWQLMRSRHLYKVKPIGDGDYALATADGFLSRITGAELAADYEPVAAHKRSF